MSHCELNCTTNHVRLSLSEVSRTWQNMAPNSVLNIINLLSLVPSWRTSSLAWDKVNEQQVDFFPFTMGNHSHNEYCLWHYKHISLKHICVTVMTSNCYIKGSQLNAMISFTNNDFCLDAVRSETLLQKKTLISVLVYIRHRSLGANSALCDSWQYHSRNKCCGIMEHVRVAGRLFGWVAPDSDPVISLFTISLSGNWSHNVTLFWIRQQSLIEQKKPQTIV